MGLNMAQTRQAKTKTFLTEETTKTERSPKAPSILQATKSITAGGISDAKLKGATVVGSLKEAHNLANQIMAGDWPAVPPGHICLPVSALSPPVASTIPDAPGAPGAPGAPTEPPAAPIVPPSCDSYACRAGNPISGVTVKVDGGSWDGECLFDRYYAWSENRDVKIRENVDDISCELRGLTIFTQSQDGISKIAQITVEKTISDPVYVYIAARPYYSSNYYQWDDIQSLVSAPDSKWELSGRFPSFYQSDGDEKQQKLIRRLMTESKLEIGIPAGDGSARQFYGFVGIGA
jgi:hypothetical protein